MSSNSDMPSLAVSKPPLHSAKPGSVLIVFYRVLFQPVEVNIFSFLADQQMFPWPAQAIGEVDLGQVGD